MISEWEFVALLAHIFSFIRCCIPTVVFGFCLFVVKCDGVTDYHVEISQAAYSPA
jgi:hypothetical protein